MTRPYALSSSLLEILVISRHRTKKSPADGPRWNAAIKTLSRDVWRTASRGKISPYGAYAVTGDGHRGRQGRKGEGALRFGSVPSKLALELFDSINLPDAPPSLSLSLSCSLPLALYRSFIRRMQAPLSE